MDKRYSAICGYTQDELETSFRDYISKWATEDEVDSSTVLKNIKTWYNGFLFSAKGIKVYNPWSTLNYFNTGELKNYWFETGTPTFLIDLIQEERFYLQELDEYPLEIELFSTFEIENLNIVALLFQTGYLTIKRFDQEYQEYYLGFPNREVEDSFFKNLLSAEVNNTGSQTILSKLRIALVNNDLELFFDSMDILMSKIDYDLHLKEEKYWQSLFYMILTLLGYKISAEFKTIKGRIDAVIETQSHIYIFEFKTTSSEEIALEQIKDREYYKRFRDSNKNIVLVGSRFVLEDKKIVNKYKSLFL